MSARQRGALHLLPTLAVLAGLSLWPAPAAAQNVSASVRGTVTDDAGAVLPAVQVTVRNVATGAAHERVTDASGSYTVPLLPPGEYEVHFALAGFQGVARRGIRLTLGQDAVVSVKLQIGQRSEELVVQANASEVNLTSGAVSGLVGEQQIRELPLNGRSFQQLALLQPGVNAALAAGNDVIGGRTPKISINGARPEQNNFLLDGTDINNVYNKTPGSAGGVLLGVEAVLEFQVLTNAYSAEFGRSAGGVINAVTRAGTNAFHGSAFEFHRNSALDAKNFFDPASQPKPDFKRHQFGATLGGPLRKDRTFFFLRLRGLRRAARRHRRHRRPRRQRAAGDPSRRPLRHPPSRDTGLPRHAVPARQRTIAGRRRRRVPLLRHPADRRAFRPGPHRSPSLQPRHPLRPRHLRQRGRDPHPAQQAAHLDPGGKDAEHLRHPRAPAHLLPRALNTLRLGLNRSVSLADNHRTIDIPPSMSWIPGDPFGYLTIQGLVTEMAGDFRLPRNDRLDNWQLGDTLLLTRGRHSARAGVQAQYLQFDQNTTSQVGGMVFTNLENFLQGRAANVDFAVPGKIDPDRKYRQWLFAAFVQDDVRLSSRLTANVGLRYEFITTPTEADGKISNLRNVTDRELTVGGAWHNNPSLRNFAPRLGLAWDPFGTGKTSVRAGFGLFYDEILPKYYFFSGSLNPPFTTRTTILNPPFPNVLANFNPDAPIRAQLQTVDYDLQTPYIMQFNLSLQRSLPGDFDVTVGYVGSRGKNLLRLGDANLAPESLVNGVKVYQPQPAAATRASRASGSGSPTRSPSTTRPS